MNRMFVQNMPMILAMVESKRVCSGCVESSRMMYTAGMIVVGKDAMIPLSHHRTSQLGTQRQWPSQRPLLTTRISSQSSFLTVFEGRFIPFDASQLSDRVLSSPQMRCFEDLRDIPHSATSVRSGLATNKCSWEHRSCTAATARRTSSSATPSSSSATINSKDNSHSIITKRGVIRQGLETLKETLLEMRLFGFHFCG